MSKKEKTAGGWGWGWGEKVKEPSSPFRLLFSPLFYISCHSPPPEDLEQTTGVITYLV